MCVRVCVVLFVWRCVWLSCVLLCMLILCVCVCGVCVLMGCVCGMLMGGIRVPGVPAGEPRDGDCVCRVCRRGEPRDVTMCRVCRRGETRDSDGVPGVPARRDARQCLIVCRVCR